MRIQVSTAARVALTVQIAAIIWSMVTGRWGSAEGWYQTAALLTFGFTFFGVTWRWYRQQLGRSLPTAFLNHWDGSRWQLWVYYVTHVGLPWLPMITLVALCSAVSWPLWAISPHPAAQIYQRLNSEGNGHHTRVIALLVFLIILAGFALNRWLAHQAALQWSEILRPKW